MDLTQENISHIKSIVDASAVSRVEMKDNLIDHLCCAVESKMKAGIQFEDAIVKALNELAPHGFKAIEFETFLLLNAKKITMKKLTYFTGLAFSVFASVGMLFKIQHWTGANELLMLGFAGLAVVFAPLLIVTKRSSTSSFSRTKDRLAFISLLLISSGGTLKILHMAAANELLILGVAAFSLGFLPMTFLKMYRESIAE
ncbi:hypothetical protein WSM22_30300 [Cytophagales bacterium WSM2-2]|nr:hypothetical protein WSM22_30300 [Cytophagales bacterium WSM2-2]